MAYANAQSHRAHGWLATLCTALSALVSGWQRSRVFVRTYTELHALSDREMHDLGINRAMITRLAHDAAYGRDD